MSARAALYWSIRRELWENRFVYLAPLVVAALVLFGLMIAAARLPAKVRALPDLTPAKQVASAVMPFSMAASLILLSCWLVAVFYCLDALNGERRDRSILFWKSMPVSDLATVLAKACIPFVVLPFLACAIALAVQLVMLLASAVVLAAAGVDAAPLWAALPFLHMPIGMVYGVAAHTLWFAPVFGWLLLVSAWVRRAAFLWAFLPFFAAFAVETLAFGTAHVSDFIKARVSGGMRHAFVPDAVGKPITQLAQLDPIGFLATPALWVSLAFAAAFIAMAVRLRRYREPT